MFLFSLSNNYRINMKFLFILLSSVLALSSMQSQRPICGTIHSEEMSIALQENKSLWSKRTAGIPRFIPITYHLVADSQGERRPSRESAYEATCILNERYEASDVDLYFYIRQFKEVDNSFIHTDPFSQGFSMTNLKHNWSMNIFVVDDIDNGSPNSVTRGYYSPAGDFLVVRKDDLGDTGYTLEHEIGHFFTLKHTHYGWEDEPFSNTTYPEKITFNSISGSSQVPLSDQPVPVELQDGSNCETAGDGLCDTPPDYGVGFSCNCCAMPYTILDKNCEQIETMMDNVMAYSGGCMERFFTPDQVSAMNASYDSNRRNYLRVTVTEDSYRPVNEQVQLLTPGSGEKVEIYDDILFSWEPVPNAEFYELVVDGDKYTVTGTEHRVFDRSANESFLFWSVKAFGPFGGGCNGAVERRFDTGSSMSSAVAELDYVSELELFPNPASTNQNVTLSFTADQSEAAKVSILDLKGRTILTEDYLITNGQNNIGLSTKDVIPGILLVEVRTNTGSIVKKLIVE